MYPISEFIITNHIVSAGFILSNSWLVSISVRREPERFTLTIKEEPSASTNTSLELKISWPPTCNLNSTSEDPSENCSIFHKTWSGFPRNFRKNSVQFEIEEKDYLVLAGIGSDWGKTVGARGTSEWFVPIKPQMGWSRASSEKNGIWNGIKNGDGVVWKREIWGFSIVV